MEDNEFRKLVHEAIDSIPEEFLSKLSNVEITVQDMPDARQAERLRLRPGILLFGLYEGVAQNKRGANYSALPDKITIFRRPIEAVSRDEEDVKKMVIDTVKHEIAHHFGMSDVEIRAAERKRRFNK